MEKEVFVLSRLVEGVEYEYLVTVEQDVPRFTSKSYYAKSFHSEHQAESYLDDHKLDLKVVKITL